MRHRRHMNPEGLINVAKSSGITAVEALAAALIASGVVVAVSKIEYAATTTAPDAAMYRVGAFSGISVLAGAAMQFGSGWVEQIGKMLIGLGLGAPAVAVITRKVQDAMISPTSTIAERASAVGGSFGMMLAGATLPAPATPPVGATAPAAGLMSWGSPFRDPSRFGPSGFASDNYSYAPSGDIASSLVSPSYIPPARG